MTKFPPSLGARNLFFQSKHKILLCTLSKTRNPASKNTTLSQCKKYVSNTWSFSHWFIFVISLLSIVSLKLLFCNTLTSSYFCSISGSVL